jgi:hypothetical protein
VTAVRGRRHALLAAALLAAATVAYVLAAWSTAPGFFDGLAPPGPYRWESPPPQFRQGNQPPLPGHGTLPIGSNGQVAPGTVQTQDGQLALTFSQGALRAPDDGTPVTVRINAQRSFPKPGRVELSTNVYCVTTTTPLVSGREALVTLTYSDGIPAPSDVFSYRPGPGASWQRLGNTGTAAPFAISVRATSLGCFAAGVENPSRGASTSTGPLSGQTLPILVAVLIVLLLLAALPIVVLRRHPRPTEDEDER